MGQGRRTGDGEEGGRNEGAKWKRQKTRQTRKETRKEAGKEWKKTGKCQEWITE